MMEPNAELVVFNARVATLAAQAPAATAFAIKNGRFVFVGDDVEAARYATGSTRQFDAGGRTIVPGFIDAHLHLMWFGQQLLQQADLVGVASIDELLGRLSQQASKTAGWIQGHGFDQDKLQEGRFPTRDDLDRVARDRPVFISRICGHATVANSAALAVLTREELAAGNERTGLFTEGASFAFYRKIPPLSEVEQDEAALMAAQVALKTGITCCQTLLDTADQMAAWARLRRRGALPLRIVGMPPYASAAALHAHGINTTFGDEQLRFGAVKLFSDGSLGARTALLAEPYADEPGTTGVRIYSPDELKRMTRDAQNKGFQIAIHAIGDGAVRETIDALEVALAGESNLHHRHRIEHASVCAPDCLDRMAKLGLLAIVQPQFIKSDSWTAARLGPKRTPWAYPFASLLRAGVPIALSSDCPVEKLNAFACLSAAVQREGVNAEQALTIEQALRAYCLGSAYASHSESYLGSIEVGKCADFVLLSEPIVDDPERIDRCSALATVVGGEVVFQQENAWA